MPGGDPGASGPAEPTAVVDGIAVYDFGGAAGAPAVLLLHGYSDSGQCWADAVARWSGDYRVFSLDARGHGRSERFTPEQLAADPPAVMAEDAAAVLGWLARERDSVRPVLVGHSMGGGVAAAVALHRPALIAGAVLEDPALAGPGEDELSEEWAAQEVGYLGRFRADPAWGRRDGREAHRSWPGAELEPWARAKLDTDQGLAASAKVRTRLHWERVVAETRVPLLLVTGTEQVLWPEPLPRLLRERAAASVRVAVIDGAGHCVRREATEGFHAVVDPWLAEVTAN